MIENSLCSVILGWMDKRRASLLSITDVGESGEVFNMNLSLFSYPTFATAGGKVWWCLELPSCLLVSVPGMPLLLWSHLPLRLLGPRLLRHQVLLHQPAGQQDHWVDLPCVCPCFPLVGPGDRQDWEEHLLGFPLRPHLHRLLRPPQLHLAQPLHSGGDPGSGLQPLGKCSLADLCSHHSWVSAGHSLRSHAGILRIIMMPENLSQNLLAWASAWHVLFLWLTDFQLQAIQNLGTALITMGAGSIVDEYVKDCNSSASSKTYFSPLQTWLLLANSLFQAWLLLAHELLPLLASGHTCLYSLHLDIWLVSVWYFFLSLVWPPFQVSDTVLEKPLWWWGGQLVLVEFSQQRKLGLW